MEAFDEQKVLILVKSNVSFSLSSKKPSGIFNWDCVESRDQFGKGNEAAYFLLYKEIYR